MLFGAIVPSSQAADPAVSFCANAAFTSAAECGSCGGTDEGCPEASWCEAFCATTNATLPLLVDTFAGRVMAPYLASLSRAFVWSHAPDPYPPRPLQIDRAATTRV